MLASGTVLWLGLLRQLVIATVLHWLPVAGRWDRTLNDVAVAATRTHMVLVDALLAGNGTLFVSGLSHLLMPALVIAAYPIGLFARLNYRDGKPAYMGDLPMVLDYVRKTANRYRELKPLVRLLDALEDKPPQVGYTF